MTPMNTIAVGVVDDHALVREGLEHLLEHAPGIRLAGSVADGCGLRALMSLDLPDVILMDIKLKDESGLQFARWLHETHPQVHVIILSNYDEGPFVIEAISVGVAGYLLKECSSALLLHTIHAVTDGAVLFKKELLVRAFENVNAGGSEKDRAACALLSKEELAVLTMMETGERNRIIGLKLHFSEATVKNRIQSILGKLGASNRTEAVAIATRAGGFLARRPRAD